MKAMAFVMLVVACKGGDKKSGRIEEKTNVDTKPVPAKTDPECANKVNQLQAWLEQLEAEKSSEEINFGWQPVIIERTPAKVTQDADYAVIAPKSVAAWDVSESNHVGDNIGAGADAKKVSDRLAAIFAMKGAKDGDELLRIDVDKDARWGEVAKLVNAATQVGYTRVVFAFEATSKLEMPKGVTGPTTDSKISDEAKAKLAEIGKTCPNWGYTPAENAAAIAACNCKVDPDEVRVQKWKAEMWHQAHTRAGVELRIAKDGNAVEWTASTPWSEAHEAILDVKEPAKLVTK